MKYIVLKLHYNRSVVAKELLDFCIFEKFQSINGGYYYPFCKIFGNVCRFYSTLLHPRLASYFVAAGNAKRV